LDAAVWQVRAGNAISAASGIADELSMLAHSQPMLTTPWSASHCAASQSRPANSCSQFGSFCRA
jgi:hypothetical protein